MSRLIPLGVLLAIAMTPSPSVAQLMCATPYGACMIAGAAAPGGPCYCVTPNGPIQGMAQVAGGVGPPATMPAFCCTPAGRMGPYNNSSIGPGQFCQVMTAVGPMAGQACY